MPGILQFLLIAAPSFIVVLGIVVFVHEFGHFQVGRWCGIAVKSFSIGMGPEWFGWTDKRGTRWKVSRIPIGGFVSWVDDTDPTSTLPSSDEDQALSDEERRARGHFRAADLWKRFVTVLAGPATNFIFSIAVFAMLAMVLGEVDDSRVPARIGTVSADSAAAEAGLQPHDIVRSVDGAAITHFSDLQKIIVASAGHPLHLQVERGGQTVQLTATPRRAAHDVSNIKAGQGMLGIAGPEPLPSELVRKRHNPIEAIGMGATQCWTMIAQTGTYIVDVITGRASGNQIAGPTGILVVSGQVANSALDVPDKSWPERLGILALSLINLAAVLSVAVGFVNLLPIPLLDGGHLLFYSIEGVRGGKPLPEVAQEWGFKAGLAIMAGLFLFATWNDIARLIPGAQ